MAKIEIEKVKENYPKIQYQIFSNEELREFGRYLDENYNGFKTVQDKERWLVDEGALSKSKLGVIIDGVPNTYQKCMNKLEQLSRYESKVKFARRMNENIDQLDHVVKIMNVNE